MKKKTKFKKIRTSNMKGLTGKEKELDKNSIKRNKKYWESRK